MTEITRAFYEIARVFPWTDESRAEFVKDNRAWLSEIPQGEKRIVWTAMQVRS